MGVLIFGWGAHGGMGAFPHFHFGKSVIFRNGYKTLIMFCGANVKRICTIRANTK